MMVNKKNVTLIKKSFHDNIFTARLCEKRTGYLS